MSRIDELIKKYCPNGVNHEEIERAVRPISAPKKLNKKDYEDTGKYPVIDQGKKYIVAYTSDNNTVLPEDEYVIFGDHTREVKFADFSFAQGADGLKIFQPKDNSTLPKFLYYVFSNLEIPNRGYNRHWSIVKTIDIPIPPLPVQQEIVAILDKFTKLEAELEAELEARQKQYAYYRDELLTFDGQDIFEDLGLVCHVASGGTPLKSKQEYWDNGNIPWLKSESCNNEAVYYAGDFITELGLKNSSAKLLQKDTTLIALVGATIFKTAYLEFEATTNQNIASVKSKDHKVLKDKFVFYYITNLYNELKSKMRNYGMLNLTTLRQFKIPVPSPEEQERIVAILDKFDALVNDISSGLPAEIAARRKQYEYYRNRLLSFQEAA